MMGDLKLCPFCGGQADVSETITDGSVHCTSCLVGIVCNHGRFTDDGLADAKAKWNTRTLTEDHARLKAAAEDAR